MATQQKNDQLSSEQSEELLSTLKARFDKNTHRHEGISWNQVLSRLQAAPQKQRMLHSMEETGGEPDVVGLDDTTDEYIFFDCATESPQGRRSLCYDRAALDARKANKPQSAAMEVAHEIGIELLTEAQYQQLQQLGEFDTKTSSWLKTPDDIRQKGGAIFGDRRFGRVFIYHNGAESYYAARGFRGALRV